jgi:hypothetical protein
MWLELAKFESLGAASCQLPRHHSSPAYTIRVKRPPKPDPVKPQPPAARRFYFTELTSPSVYIFVSSHVLINVANATPVAGYPRYPPRRFVSSPSAAPTAPLGPTFPASPGCHLVHFDLDEPQSLAHMPPSNSPGAGDGADDDVKYWLRPPGLGIPYTLQREELRATSLSFLRLLDPFGAKASRGALRPA